MPKRSKYPLPRRMLRFLKRQFRNPRKRLFTELAAVVVIIGIVVFIALSRQNITTDDIKEGRTSEDLLTQVILDLGLTLDLKIEEKVISSNKVYFVESNSLIACFDNNVNIDIIDEICKYKPLKVVFKDISFKSDKDKINLEERIKKLSPETEISIL